MNLSIILAIIIGVLVIAIIIIIKKLREANIALNTLESDYKEWQEEFTYTRRELDRCKEQIKVYEKTEEDTPTINLVNKTIKKNPIYKGKRALVGDYMDISSDNTIKVLQSFGITVDIVRSGEDIIDKIKHGYNYDIIFTNNVYNKGCDGYNTLLQLKEIKNFNTPVVIHTVSSNQRDTFINHYGFDEYIEKPLDQEKVKPILDKFFKNKKGASTNDRKRNR